MPLFFRLLAATMVLAAFILGLGMYSSAQIGETAKYIDKVYAGPLQSINFARTAENNFLQLNFALYKAFQEKKLNEDGLQDINASQEIFADSLKVAEERSQGEKSKKALADIRSSMREWTADKDKLSTSGATYDALASVSGHIQSRLSDLSEFEATAGFDYVIAAGKKAADIEKQNLIVTVIAVLAGLIISMLVSLNIIRPIQKCVGIAESISEGNLENTIATNRSDELGKLLRAFAKMQTGLVKYIENRQRAVHEAEQAEQAQEKRQMLAALSNDLQQSMQSALNAVAEAVSGLNAVSEELSFAAQQSLIQSGSSSEKINQVGAGISSAASAAEQLSSSILDIKNQTSRSSQTAEKASQSAARANEAVLRLGETSTQVDTVLSIITNIASQINLLALNATIESARAGEAGKGFAVVACEVKDLAKQTEEATKQVRLLIANVQTVSQDVVQAIQNISASIGEVQDISSAIVGTMSDQSNATQEISTMVQATSASTNEAVSIMQRVTESSKQTKESSEKVMNASNVLDSQMKKLESSIAVIVDKIRVA